MRLPVAVAAASLLLVLCCVDAGAVEYRSIAAAAAILYDAPSTKSRKAFILNRGYPVEIIVSLDAWLKVRDANGELAWLETKNSSTQRTVMVKVARADVRRAPEETAAVAFQVDHDVVLEVLQITDNWAHVKHRDGTTGYIRITQVWGL